MDTFKNALETVQLIPIFNYINILSDFLFIEEYLSEIDQSKQIPIVNALYKYLEDHENSKIKMDQLIRNLLEGSDLYGEKDNEIFDITFVNAMFEYIISSLVFEKYGNIYGFLANIFHEVENLQIETVLYKIIINLDSASFENEYGDSSTLSLLSVERIYNDIILPLFPPQKKNINILSYDYIYAQAGSMFLRAGRINTTYYNNFESSVKIQQEEHFFDKCLTTGYVIDKLLQTEEYLNLKNFHLLKVFALPALTYYVFNSKYLFDYENIANIISDTNFWQMAYIQLFQYTTKALSDMEHKLKNGYILEMHMALSSFQSSAAMAKIFIEQHCTNLTPNERVFILSDYLFHPTTFQCKDGEPLPNLEEYTKSQINNITEIYEKHDFQLVQDAFPQYLIQQLEQENVIIKLLVPDNTEKHGNFSVSELLPYDILEFYFTKNITFNYYYLEREDYNVKLINVTDNPHLFNGNRRLNFSKLYNMSTHKTLKTTNKNFKVFLQNLIKYKKSRLETYLKILDNYGENKETLKSDWWKEFGLSLVPYYPCLSNKSRDNCSAFNINYLNDYELTLGPVFRKVFFEIATSEIIDAIVPKRNEYHNSIINIVNGNELFEDISFHIKDPSFQLTYTTKNEIEVIKKIINSLKEKTDFSFNSVITCLSKISILKSTFFKRVGTIGSNSTYVYVNVLDNKSNNGYGYKFIFIPHTQLKIALVRTGYELRDERIFLQQGWKKGENKYVALSNETLQPEPDHNMYEINNKLWRKPTKLLFSRIPVSEDDYDQQCFDVKYFNKWRHANRCRRQQHFVEKFDIEEEAVKLINNNTNLSKKQIRNMIDRFTIPDKTIMIRFIDDGLKNNSFKEPIWSRNYIIDYPDLLNELRYHSHFESHHISDYEGKFRINSLYSKAERRQIEENASIGRISQSYNDQRGSFAVTFHDYYAIRNFATTGYTRITGDTNEAKLMKIALYKLAIRQSDDPDGEFDLKLFRVESKPITILRIISSKEYITLRKFTQTSTNFASAIRFTGYPTLGCLNVIYEMVFNGSYVRAKIEQFYKEKQENIILLPGTQFKVENHRFVDIGGLGHVLKLQLTYIHDDKYVWYKNIMKEIANTKI
ncbi:uncharacterized protein LOC127291431 [Leptopilina boulardi]|uniref:uncharacterized protein LOC127291431 n=1 Tax=Leptopilina boulardi TaxID=63433 RepID=UPI0021F5638C|nr:uncharacterized protein LOC127291431 [Leptopilina boulardi]